MAALDNIFGTQKYTIALEATWEECLAAANSNRKIHLETDTALTTLLAGKIGWYIKDSIPIGTSANQVFGTGVVVTTTAGVTAADFVLPAGYGLWVRTYTGGGTPGVLVTTSPCVS